MKITDLLSLSFRTLKSNKLRTGITVAIIALGIMALIVIITAIEAMNQKFTESFSTMGANGFTIRFKERNIRLGGGGDDMKVSKKGARRQKQSNLNKPVREDEAEMFARSYKFPESTVSISAFSGNNHIVSYESRKTSPNVFLFGSDENYLAMNGYTLAAGRNFSRNEIQQSQNVCILGHDVALRLFRRDPTMAVNKMVRIDNSLYRVIAVLASRGSSFGFSRDNIAIIGYKSIKALTGVNSYAIGVKISDVHQLENAMGEAEGLFRAIRKLSVTEESNFVVESSNSVAETAMSILGFLTGAVIIIGFITLGGSSIGLMNIMLVAVTERTKEVGLIKAIGGRGRTVRLLFLMEAVMISLMGALLGIVTGVLIGNLVSLLLDTGFVVPWRWVCYGIVICTIVGLIAGLYPALKAGKLNPIEALRYE